MRFTIRAELRLIRRAIRDGWPVGPEQVAREMARLAEILEDPATTPRELLAAARVLDDAERAGRGLPPARRERAPRRPRRRR